MKFERALSCLAAVCAATGGIALADSAALAGDIEVIFTKIPGHPTSVVPGARDLEGLPAVTRFRALHDLVGSPDGSQWLLRARTQQGSDLENILLLGSGNDGTAFAQEGLPVHGGQLGEVYDFFGSGLGRFNDNNDFAFSARARGGVSAHAQKVIRVINGFGEIAMQQGDPYVGLIDAPGNVSGDELVGNSIGSIHLLNDGTIGAHDGTIQNIHTGYRPALFYDNVAFHQRNITQVLGMDGETWYDWDLMTGNTFYTSPNASPISLAQGGSDDDRWLAIGRHPKQSGSDRMLVVNGQIALEAGAPLPGLPNIVSSIFTNVVVLSNGDWFVRGASDGGTRHWAVRNGEVFAVTSDPIASGTDERWATNIIHFSGNNAGDWVLIGRTDNPDNTRDEVIVVNGQVVAREGDPIDLSGNGQFDDDVFIGRTNPNNFAFTGDAFISEDGYLYFFANIMDGDGNEFNSDPSFGAPTALLRLSIDPDQPCLGDLNGNGVVDVSDLLILLGGWGECPRSSDCLGDLNNDGVVDVSDLLILLGAWGECP